MARLTISEQDMRNYNIAWYIKIVNNKINYKQIINVLSCPNTLLMYTLKKRNEL